MKTKHKLQNQKKKKLKFLKLLPVLRLDSDTVQFKLSSRVRIRVK
jgi:hypothetical protein